MDRVEAATGYAKTNGLWELQNLLRSGWEWIELQFQQLKVDLPSLPDWQTPPWLEGVMLWLVLVMGGVLLVLLGEQIWRWALRSQHLWKRYLAQQQTLATDAPIQRSLAEWLALAQTFQAQGNFKEACRALYMALLQHLQDLQLIRLHHGWTDQEYVAQIRILGLSGHPQPELHPYETLLTTHERLCFSQSEISEQDFLACSQAYEQITAASSLGPNPSH